MSKSVWVQYKDKGFEHSKKIPKLQIFLKSIGTELSNLILFIFKTNRKGAVKLRELMHLQNQKMF